MTYLYEVGAVRWRRPPPNNDVRAYRPQRGWTCRADLIDAHPITGRQLKFAQWWLREEYVGDPE